MDMEQEVMNLRDSSKDSYSISNTHLMSDDIRQLAQAFLQAKQSMGGAKKNSKSNLHKYANLTAVYEAVEEALFSNNIIIWHFAERLDENDLVLHTRLIHSPTGQFIQDTRPMKSEKPGNQGIGSANTYMRRYAVLNLCALGDEDDDGEAERSYIEKKQYNTPTDSPLINVKQVEELKAALKSDADGKAKYDKILSYNEVDDLSKLTEHQFRLIMRNQFKK